MVSPSEWPVLDSIWAHIWVFHMDRYRPLYIGPFALPIFPLCASFGRLPIGLGFSAWDVSVHASGLIGSYASPAGSANTGPQNPPGPVHD